jgi:hypothetical protein
MRFGWCVIVLCGAACAWAQEPPEMPAHKTSLAAGADLTKKRTVKVMVTSRRSMDPDNLEILEKLKATVVAALPKTPLTVAGKGVSADATLEVVDEPHERWGTAHSQVNPYIFLLLRERTTGHLLYCAYRRAGFVHSATDELMNELGALTRGKGPLPDGDIARCAGEAMRPF